MATATEPKKRASTYEVRGEFVNGKIVWKVPARKHKALQETAKFAQTLQGIPDLQAEASAACEAVAQLLGKLGT